MLHFSGKSIRKREPVRDSRREKDTGLATRSLACGGKQSSRCALSSRTNIYRANGQEGFRGSSTARSFSSILLRPLSAQPFFQHLRERQRRLILRRWPEGNLELIIPWPVIYRR
jgi:hypothetical protein